MDEFHGEYNLLKQNSNTEPSLNFIYYIIKDL